MNNRLNRFIVPVIATLVLGQLLGLRAQDSQTLVVHSTANVRQSASSGSAVVVHLTPGAELTLLSPTKRSGFYHVRTASGQEGWIYQTLVHVPEENEPEPAAPAAAPATSSELDPNWEKPAPIGSVLKGPPGTQPCPATGEAGGDLETNRRKNRTDVPASYHTISFGALANLPYPDASTNRSKWTAVQLAQIAPFEGVPVSIVGYLVAVKKQFGGSGEATNCHYLTQPFVDTHMALVEKPGQGEEKAIVVEPTPRFYAKHPTWLFSKLTALDHAANAVRISGWTLMDPVHKAHLGTYRMTLWEIHPITKIEIFRNGQWTEW